MPSTLILHYPVPPSEPLAAALTISYNDCNLQGKTSATKHQNIYILESRRHRTTQQGWKEVIWRGHCCNDSSVRGAGVSRAHCKGETNGRVHERSFYSFPISAGWQSTCSHLMQYEHVGKWLPPLLFLPSTPSISVTAWLTFTFCIPVCWYNTSCKLHSILCITTSTELLTWLSTTGTFFFLQKDA